MTGKIRNFGLLLAAITLLGAGFRLYGISGQPPLSDEVQVAFTAVNFVERGHFVPTMPHHPNLRNILTYYFMKAFGAGPLGLRGVSLILGTLCVPILGLLTYRVTSSVTASCVSALLLAIDPLNITFSRQAIMEVHTVFFFLLGSLLMVHWAAEGGAGWPRGRKMSLPPLAGIVFGLGLASKAHALFPLLVCLALAVYRAFREKDAAFFIYVSASLVVLPFTVFLLSDLPWFNRGYSLSDWLFMKRTVLESMSVKYMPYVMEKNIDVSALEWFVKPFLGYVSFTVSAGREYITVGMGNPIVMLAVIPASVYALLNGPLRERTWLLHLFFWTSYAPLVLTKRPIFFLSATAVTPFAYAIVAAAADKVTGRARRTALCLYLCAVLAASIVMMPLTMGKALDYGYTRQLTARFNPHPGMGGGPGPQ